MSNGRSLEEVPEISLADDSSSLRVIVQTCFVAPDTEAVELSGKVSRLPNVTTILHLMEVRMVLMARRLA